MGVVSFQNAYEKERVTNERFRRREKREREREMELNTKTKRKRACITTFLTSLICI